MIALLVALIFVLAFIFSMMGLGGALVYNPLMVWFGYDFKSVVVPTGLLLNGLTVASAAWAYYRRKMIDFSVALPLVITSALGAPAGAYVTQFISTDILLALFAVAVLLAAGRMLMTSGGAEPEVVRGTARQRTFTGGVLGLGIGFIAGLLGIGGGFLIVPLLLLMGYPTKVAAATTAFTVVFSSATGFLGHLAVGHFDWMLMAALSLAVVLGSQLGARAMATRLQPRRLKQMFAIVLLFVGGRLLWGLL